MMSVEEYANDVDKTVEEILNKCLELGIEANDSNYELSEEDIINLDNNMDDDSVYDEMEYESKKEMKAANKKEKKKIGKDSGKTSNKDFA